MNARLERAVMALGADVSYRCAMDSRGLGMGRVTSAACRNDRIRTALWHRCSMGFYGRGSNCVGCVGNRVCTLGIVAGIVPAQARCLGLCLDQRLNLFCTHRAFSVVPVDDNFTMKVRSNPRFESDAINSASLPASGRAAQPGR